MLSLICIVFSAATEDIFLLLLAYKMIGRNYFQYILTQLLAIKGKYNFLSHYIHANTNKN